MYFSVHQQQQQIRQTAVFLFTHLHANLLENSVPTLAGVHAGVTDDVAIQRQHLCVRHACYSQAAVLVCSVLLAGGPASEPGGVLHT